jgi:Ca-activated chloride channel family protein
LKRSIDLPVEAVEHLFIPRNWAKARVDFLLRKIEMEGEDAASISEIIALSKKYKFVTPYTSFLRLPIAAVRSSNRAIGVTRTDRHPYHGDFPFGLTKPYDICRRTGVADPVSGEMVDGVYH